jgi:hypothetical protein
MSAWQPIETAPKDGTRVDLWAKAWSPFDDTFHHQRCANCYWVKQDTIGNSPAHWVHLDSGWFPTHWMPLPDPPSGKGQAA